MPKALSSASLWHYVSLGAGLIVILALQSSQWFFFDEWAFLEPASPGLFEPHVGHWSTAPLLVYKGLVAVFGLHSYLPFAIGVTLLHLAIAHLIWRVLLRIDARPWIATLATTGFVFLGAGSENILWAFQIGFLGGLAFGLLAFVIAIRPTLSTSQFVAVVAISVFSLSWSGTSIPLVAATAFALWRIHDWRRAAVYLAVTAGVYLAWYIAFAIGSPSNPDTGGFSATKLFIEIPQFIGVMLILGFSSITPVPLLGFLFLVALAVWIIVLLVRRRPIAALIPGFALLLAAAIFALLSAYSRASFSVGGGRASRYIYVLVLLLLPLLAVALSRLDRSRGATALIAAGLVLIAGYQASQLLLAAREQADIEQGSHEVISASLSLYIDDPAAVDPASQPDPTWAPDLDMAGLIELYRDGLIEPGAYGPDDLAAARVNLGIG